MSRVYNAMRHAAEEQQDHRTNTAELPSAVDFVDDSFPLEEFVAEQPVAAAAAAGIGTAYASQAALPHLPRTHAVPRREDAPPAGTEAPPPARFERGAARYEGKTVIDTAMSAQSREQYRRLAATLHRAQAVNGIKVVMVTSAMAAEGKTLTAANVALTLSQSYQKQVLLVDADLRRPSLQELFGLPAGPGLSEGLTSQRERAVRVQLVSQRLGILQAGRPTSDPIAALTSERMRRLIGEARKNYDWIILDTPPVALLTDASLVSSMTDGAVLVVRAGHTPYELVERAVAAVGRDRTLGVVLNQAEPHSNDYYAKYPYASGGTSE
jgi:capsular exopolysaccharide synthesis family protein